MGTRELGRENGVSQLNAVGGHSGERRGGSGAVTCSGHSGGEAAAVTQNRHSMHQARARLGSRCKVVTRTLRSSRSQPAQPACALRLSTQR